MLYFNSTNGCDITFNLSKSGALSSFLFNMSNNLIITDILLFPYSSLAKRRLLRIILLKQSGL